MTVNLRTVMHDHDNIYICSVCLATFELPEGADVSLPTIAAAGMRSIRVVLADGSEVHRCAYPPSVRQVTRRVSVGYDVRRGRR
jgi:hypothetical protein